jgi:hypothetical protein
MNASFVLERATIIFGMFQENKLREFQKIKQFPVNLQKRSSQKDIN